MSGTQTSFVDNLTAAIGDNPLAAALIGGGALWLLMGTERLNRAARAAAAPVVSGARTLRSAADKIENSPPTAPDLENEPPQHDADTLHTARKAASDATSEAADTIRGGVREANQTVRNLSRALPGEETVRQVQSSLSDLLEKQPLVLGAVGLAVGAAVAGAFKTSRPENEWMGGFSDNVKADLNARAGAVSQSVHEASDMLKTEVQDTAAEAMERLRQTTSNAVNAAREEVTARSGQPDSAAPPRYSGP
jgi:hypothetical protein